MTVTLREFVQEELATVWQNLRTATDDLTPDQLRWRPEPEGNSIGYLLWHTGRVEDNFIQRFILRGDELWAAKGWQERFGYETRGIGTGFSPEQTTEVPVNSLALIWGYLDEVRASTLEYIVKLDFRTLKVQPRPNIPQWTIQTILRQLSAHANQHLGEINYLRGLQRLPGALG